MKVIVKILLSPFILLLVITELMVGVIINLAGPILNIISTVTLVAGAFTCFNDGVQAGKSILMVSWLVSALGIPLFAQFIIQIISTIKNRLLSI